MPPPVFRNLAFISHTAADQRGPGRLWADWVAEAIDGFAVPRQLVGRPTAMGPIPARLGPVIKADRQRGDAFTAEARAALEQSRALVVVCSPAGAVSEAVEEEIRWFKQLGRDRIIAVLVAGEPDAANAKDECFPETLKFEVRKDGTIDREWRVHPVVVDLRPQASDGLSTGDRLAQGRTLLAAALIGVPPEALPGAGRDLVTGEAPRRRSNVAVALAVAGLVAAGGAGWFAYQQREQALAAAAARKRSDEVIVFLQRSMREKLAPIGQLGLLADVNERVTDHLARVGRETNDPTALAGLADAFRDSAEILESRGNHQGAIESATQAAQTRQRIAENPDAPADTAVRLIGDQLLVGQILSRMGQHAEALAVAEQSRAAAVALSRKRLGDESAELALTQAHRQAGDALLQLAKLEPAERAFVSARDAARQLAARSPRNLAAQEELAAATERFASLKERQGDFRAAITELAEWQRLLAAKAAATSPEEPKALTALANAQLRLGNVHAFQRQIPEAAREYRKAVETSERAAKAQPDNRDAQLAHVTALHRLGATLANDANAQPEAIGSLDRALAHLDRHFAGETELPATTTRAEIRRLRDSLAARQQ